MTNFTSKIRKDLLRTVPDKRCCRLALLAALLDTSGSCTFGLKDRRDEFSFTGENEEVAEYFLSEIEKLFGISMTVTEAVRDPKHGKNKLTFAYDGEGAGGIADEITDYCAVNLWEEERECCRIAYLKGAFLGSGSATLPADGAKTGYHLEFVFSDSDDADGFLELLDTLQLICNVVPRGEKYVVYCKNRDTISDFLSVVGAEHALRQLREISAVREEKNNLNRIENCCAGNADKSAIASAAQIVAIAELEQKGVLDELPAPLRDAARARAQNPTFSLAELSRSLGLSKSCLNHRLRKLMQLYENLRKS